MKNTVLVTGSSRGIGAGIIQAFARSGYNVIINYFKSENAALTLKNNLVSQGYSAIAVKADVSNADDVANMIKIANNKFGKIDVLINNAGIAQIKLFNDVTAQEWDEMFNTNVKSAFICTQAVLPQMISRKQGKIINISSIWGITGASCEVVYSATKSALIGMTKALAKELGPSGITVNCVAPGVIETDMISDMTQDTREALVEEMPLGAIGTVDDIANCVLYLASEGAGFVTGQVISPNGGMVI